MRFWFLLFAICLWLTSCKRGTERSSSDSGEDSVFQLFFRDSAWMSIKNPLDSTEGCWKMVKRLGKNDADTLLVDSEFLLIRHRLMVKVRHRMFISFDSIVARESPNLYRRFTTSGRYGLRKRTITFTPDFNSMVMNFYGDSHVLEVEEYERFSGSHSLILE